GTLRLWSRERLGEQQTRIESKPLQAFAKPLDQNLIFLGWGDNEIDVWDSNSLKKTRTLTLDTGDVTALSVDANAHQLVTRHGAELIRLWTTSDDAGAQRKWEKRNRTTRIALSALGTRLAFVSSGSYKGGLTWLATTSLSSTPALPSEAVT